MAPQVPHKAQKKSRSHALCNRVGAEGWNLSENDAQHLLQQNEWDADRAFAEWQQQRNNTNELLRQNPPQGPTLPPTVGNEPVAYSLIPEQERRGLVTNLRNLILDGRGDFLTRGEAVLWLHRHNFDLEQAINAYTTHARARRLLYEIYDRLREPETPEGRSDALAILINITRRGDWWSLSEFLASHNWDLPLAVAAWHQSGIPPVRHPQDHVGGNPGYGRRRTWTGQTLQMPSGQDTAVGDEAGKDWPAKELKAFGEDKEDDKSEAESEAETVEDGWDDEEEQEGEVPTKAKQSKSKSRGAVINDDPDTAKVNCPDETKFYIECIKDGKYYTREFDHSRYQWPQRAAGAGQNDTRPLFSWSNQADVRRLNNWYRQARQRITGSILRRASQRFSQEELNFLFNLYQTELNNRMAADPNKPRDEFLPMTIGEDRWKEWTDAFNREFVGRRLSGSREPRLERSRAGLATQASRIPRICETFKVKPDHQSSMPNNQKLAEHQEEGDEAADNDQSEATRPQSQDEPFDEESEGELEPEPKRRKTTRGRNSGNPSGKKG